MLRLWLSHLVRSTHFPPPKFNMLTLCCLSGWVGYGVTAAVSALGENSFMPLPDTPCMVINSRSGYTRDNKSWIIGRVLRDYETWMDPGVRDRMETILNDKHQELQQKAEKQEAGSGASVSRPKRAGLCVSFYDADKAVVGCPGNDIVYYSGFAVAIIQLGVASIPLGIFGDWSILFITAAGIMLSFTTGLLSHWRKEKWACRLMSNKTVVLTRGNGAQHAIVIRGGGLGFDLEDLASGSVEVDASGSWASRLAVILLALAWILLLISAAGIHSNTWFLLGVGAIGIVQNMFVAGWRRNPAAFGMPLVFDRAVGDKKVMKALYKVADIDPQLGLSMKGVFFPGELRTDEVVTWREYSRRAAVRQANAVQ